MRVFLFIPNIEHGFSKDAIDALAKRCEHLYVLSPQVISSFEEGNVSFDREEAAPKGIKPSYLLQTIAILIKDLFRARNWAYVKSIKLRAGHINTIFKRADCFNKKFGSVIDNSVLLSFWFDYDAVLVARLKTITNQTVACSFAHGRDLYEWRQPKTGVLPFRIYQMRNLNKVFSISKKGMNYLKERQPHFSKKFDCNYLGSKDHGLGMFDPNQKFTLVTCAKIRNIKRVSHLFDIISLLEFPVRWIHLGGSAAPEKDPESRRFQIKFRKFKTESLHLEFINKGELDKNELVHFYKKNSINLFISLSETEGLPVSMMEAISFGIPILSTDVGGCNEIVTPETGVLVDSDLDYEEIAKQITKFQDSEMNSLEFREGVRRFWEENFNIDKNYDQLFEKIKTTHLNK